MVDSVGGQAWYSFMQSHAIYVLVSTPVLCIHPERPTCHLPAAHLPTCHLQVPLMVACTAPFLAGPRVQLGYTLGAQAVSQSLALPVIAPKFCTPPDSAVPREAFFQRWRTLEGKNTGFTFERGLAVRRQPTHCPEYAGASKCLIVLDGLWPVGWYRNGIACSKPCNPPVMLTFANMLLMCSISCSS